MHLSGESDQFDLLLPAPANEHFVIETVRSDRQWDAWTIESWWEPRPQPPETGELKPSILPSGIEYLSDPEIHTKATLDRLYRINVQLVQYDSNGNWSDKGKTIDLLLAKPATPEILADIIYRCKDYTDWAIAGYWTPVDCEEF